MFDNYVVFTSDIILFLFLSLSFDVRPLCFVITHFLFFNHRYDVRYVDWIASHQITILSYTTFPPSSLPPLHIFFHSDVCDDATSFVRLRLWIICHVASYNMWGRTEPVLSCSYFCIIERIGPKVSPLIGCMYVCLFPQPFWFSIVCFKTKWLSFLIIFSGFEWLMHIEGKRELSETISQTWERRTWSSHCWGERSTTRTAPVAKWIKTKSWVRDKAYPLEIFLSYGYWCCLMVNISLNFEHFNFWKSWLLLFLCSCWGLLGCFVSAMFDNATSTVLTSD